MKSILKLLRFFDFNSAIDRHIFVFEIAKIILYVYIFRSSCKFSFDSSFNNMRHYHRNHIAFGGGRGHGYYGKSSPASMLVVGIFMIAIGIVNLAVFWGFSFSYLSFIYVKSLQSHYCQVFFNWFWCVFINHVIRCNVSQ